MSLHNLKPLSEVMNELKAKGYEEDFAFDHNKLFTLGNTSSKYDASELEVNEEYRFEGDSDPGNMTILYALTSKDGTKGTISNAYGADTDQDLAEFMRKVKHA